MHFDRITLTRHARQRLSRLNCLDVFGLVRNAEIKRECKKDGETGTLLVRMRKRDILFEFTLRNGTLYIITVKVR